MATKIVVEPLFEAYFLDCSYGFRPRRSVRQAIEAIRQALNFKRQTVVIDADIRCYFDSIQQDILMNLVKRRISDKRVLQLIQGWLRAGVMDGREYQEPDGLGTPQGGVISPLLANIYLHSFDKMFEQAGIPGTLVRYADDFVILLRSGGRRVLNQVRQMLSRLGLKLHEEKTRVVRAEKGFDFLGVHLRLRPVRKRGSRLGKSCRIWPSERSKLRLKDKVRQGIGRQYHRSLEEIIAEVNQVLQGWKAFHKPMCNERRHLRQLNYFIWDRFRIFLKRKYDDQSRGGRRVHGNVLARLGLIQFA
jgi:RNA-directed DNA polymerase